MKIQRKGQKKLKNYGGKKEGGREIGRERRVERGIGREGGYENLRVSR